MKQLNNGYDDYEIDDFMYLGDGVWLMIING